MINTSKKVRNGFVLFLANILLYHIIFFLGIFTFGRMGVHNINFLILLPCCVYVLILLVYEKPLLNTLCIDSKVYWLLTVIAPCVVYGVFWCLSIEPLTTDPWYLLFFGSFFFFTVIIVGVIKIIIYFVKKVKHK